MYNTTAEIKLLLKSRHCKQIYKNIVKSHTRSIEPEFHSTLKKRNIRKLVQGNVTLNWFWEKAALS